MLFVFPGQALFRRELLQTLRSPRHYWIMAAVWVIFAGGVVAAWPDAERQHTPEVFTQFSNQVIIGMNTIIALLVCLLVPALAGSSITLERENDTYDLLHLTLIRPLGIVWSKLLNSVGVLVLCVVAMLPVAGSVFFLVGVSWSDFAAKSVMLLFFALGCGAVAICASAYFRRTIAALAAAYVGMLFLLGLFFPLCMIVSALIHDFFGGSYYTYNGPVYEKPLAELANLFVQIFEVLSTYTPAYLFFGDVLNFANVGIRTPNPGPLTYVLVFLFMLVYFVVFVNLASIFLGGPPPTAKVNAKKPIDNRAQLEQRRKQFPYYLVDPQKRKSMIPDGRNPLLVKELRWGLFGELSRMIRIFYICLILGIIVVSSLFMLSSRRDVADSAKAAMLVMIALSLLPLPALLANTLSKEREQGNIDLLRMSLITPRDIVLGKFTAGIFTALPFYFATVFSAAILVMTSLVSWGEANIAWAVVQGLITLLVLMLFLVALSLLVSACTRSSQSAMTATYLFALFILFGGYIGTVACLEFYSSQMFQSAVTLKTTYRMSNEEYYAIINEALPTSPIMAYGAPFGSFYWVKYQPFNTVPWLLSIILYACLSAVLAMAAVAVFRYSKAWRE